MTTSRGGRRPRLTDDLEARILTEIRRGSTLRAAAAVAGVHEGVLAEWRARGEGRHARPRTPRLARFAEAVDRALGESEAALVARLVEAAKKPKEWRAAAWLLERRWPETYGRRIEATIENGPRTAELESEIETLERRIAEAEAEAARGGE